MCVFLLIFNNWFYPTLSIDTSGGSVDHKPLAQSCLPTRIPHTNFFRRSCSSRTNATTWRTFVDISLAARLPTRRGCRAGIRNKGQLHEWSDIDYPLTGHVHALVATTYCKYPLWACLKLCQRPNLP